MLRRRGKRSKNSLALTLRRRKVPAMEGDTRETVDKPITSTGYQYNTLQANNQSTKKLHSSLNEKSISRLLMID